MATYEQIQQHRHEDMEKVRARFVFHGAEPINDSGVTLSEAVEQACKNKVDPWVKVGTTTIDGTVAQVGGHMLNGGKPSTLRPDTIENFIDGRVKSQEPLQVGGRWLRLVGSHINSHTDTALIRCDVVRRQSEIETEGAAKQTVFDEEVAAMEARDYPRGLPRPPCPECGPHGNRGEVLLASSWAKCTTCAGGKPGDLWGEVKVEEPLFICGVDVNSKPTYDEVRAALVTTIKGLQTYSEGERVVDRWGRTGVVVPADESWPKSVRVRMDAGWTGIFSLREIAGKAGE